jgi:hypothetical protein
MGKRFFPKRLAPTRAEGDAICDASLGLFVSGRDDDDDDDDDDDEKENDNPKPVASAKTTKKSGRRLSSGTAAGRHSGGEDNYQMIELIFKKYLDEKQEDKRRRMEYNERRIALKEKRAEDERVSRQLQHDMMMALIASLNKK